jgi:hypothetical protein
MPVRRYRQVLKQPGQEKTDIAEKGHPAEK